MKLPNRIFVKLDVPEGEAHRPMDYLIAHINMARLVEMDETVEVGTYQLIETATLKGVFQIDDRRPHDKFGQVIPPQAPKREVKRRRKRK